MPQYTVRSGDSLWAIAERLLGDGRRFAEIAQLNGIANPSLIHPGQTLDIPYDQPQGGSGAGQPQQAAMAPTRGAVPLPRPNPSRPMPVPVPMPRPDPRRVQMPPAIGSAIGHRPGAPSPGIEAPPMAPPVLGAPVPIPPPGGYGRDYALAPPNPFAGAPLLPGARGPAPSINGPPALPGLAPPNVAMNPATMPPGETYPSAMAAANATMQLAPVRDDLQERAAAARERAIALGFLPRPVDAAAYPTDLGDRTMMRAGQPPHLFRRTSMYNPPRTYREGIIDDDVPIVPPTMPAGGLGALLATPPGIADYPNGLPHVPALSGPPPYGPGYPLYPSPYALQAPLGQVTPPQLLQWLLFSNPFGATMRPPGV